MPILVDITKSIPAVKENAVLDAAKAYADAAELQAQAAEALDEAAESADALAAHTEACDRLDEAERALKCASLVFAGHDPELAD